MFPALQVDSYEGSPMKVQVSAIKPDLGICKNVKGTTFLTIFFGESIILMKSVIYVSIIGLFFYYF